MLLEESIRVLPIELLLSKGLLLTVLPPYYLELIVLGPTYLKVYSYSSHLYLVLGKTY